MGTINRCTVHTQRIVGSGSEVACLQGFLAVSIPLKRGGGRPRPSPGEAGWDQTELRDAIRRRGGGSPPGAQARADLPFSRGGGASGIASLLGKRRSRSEAV